MTLCAPDIIPLTESECPPKERENSYRILPTESDSSTLIWSSLIKKQEEVSTGTI